MLKKRKDKKVQIVHTDSKSQKRKSIQVTDKRFWAKNETAIEEAPPVESATEAPVTSSAPPPSAP